MKISRIIVAAMMALFFLIWLRDPLSNAFGTVRVQVAVDVVFWLLAALLVAVALAYLCFWKKTTQSRGFFLNSEINGQTAFLILDTGSSEIVLKDSGARRLGVKFSQLTEVKVNSARGLMCISSTPVKMVVNRQIITGPVLVLNRPWHARHSSLLLEDDGLIGWPTIRDNIIFFDSGRRTIRALDKAPVEETGWQKLKVLPQDILALEIFLPDGKTGVIFVDTGIPWGVCLPSAQWKAWRMAHPQAALAKDWAKIFGLAADYMPGAHRSPNCEAWADEISLGALTLTDVPVRAANSAQDGKQADYVASLGLYALTRIDLVVDSKAGFAYVRPKPSPGPPYPGFRARHGQGELCNENTLPADWTVAEDLRLDPRHTLRYSAQHKISLKDYDVAIAELNHAIECEPAIAENYVLRSWARRKRGDDAGALVDAEHALAMDPGDAAAYVARGLAKQKTGNYAGSDADFDSARKLGMDTARLRLVHSVVKVRRRVQQQTDYASVIADCTCAIELNPLDADAYLRRGEAKNLACDHDGAIADLNRAIELDPKSAPAYMTRGLAKLDKKNHPGALADFAQARKFGANIFVISLLQLWSKIQALRAPLKGNKDA